MKSRKDSSEALRFKPCQRIDLARLRDSGAHATRRARRPNRTAPKGVLVLYWYGKDNPANVTVDQRIQAVLRSAPAGSIEYYAEYLETDRFPGESQALLMRDYLRGKYANQKIDVIIALSSTSLGFLLKYRNDLFPNHSNYFPHFFAHAAW